MSKQQPLVMPKMSMTMEEGTLVVWHKSEGEQIRSGDVVCEVTTDKVDMEVESPLAGTLDRIVAQPEDVIAVGEPIAYVATEDDDLLEGLLDGPASPNAGPAPDPTPDPAPRPAAAVQGAVAAVPYARTLATELGVDLTEVKPTGPQQTIRVQDVQQAAAQQPGAQQPAAPASSGNSLAKRPDSPGSTGNSLAKRQEAKDGRSRLRAAVARTMSASAEIPQFTVYRDLNLDTARRDGCGWTAVLTHAFAHALRAHPRLNATWTDDGVRLLDGVGVALAVDTPGGLFAPVLRDPDLVTLPVLERRIQDLVGRARAGTLEAADLEGASTTVSNLGAWQVHSFQAMLTPPQATALSVGAVGPQVVPVSGGIGVRTRCRVGLTLDHRVADGADAARLLATLQQLLDASPEPVDEL